MVPVTGLEPVQYLYRKILSLLCLPFHHTDILRIILPQKAEKSRPNFRLPGRGEAKSCRGNEGDTDSALKSEGVHKVDEELYGLCAGGVGVGHKEAAVAV